MTTLDDKAWANLLTLGREATNRLDDDEREFALWAIEANRVWVSASGLDDEFITLWFDDRRLLTVSRLVLARSNRNPQDN